MKNSGYSIILVLLSLAFLLPSCRREELPELAIRGNVHGEAVSVRLLFDLDREEAGTPGAAAYVNIVSTKALDDSGDGTSTKIEDFWLLQFNGTADTSTLIGESQYYRYADFMSDANPNKAGQVKLIASSKPDAVFVLANTCDSTLLFPYGMTMADLKSRVKDIRSGDDLFGRMAGSDTSRIMLNAQMNTKIDGTGLNFELKRNIAKIKVIFKNETSSTDCPVTVRSLSLHNVPNTSRYFTNTENQPDYIPSSELIQTFNYPAVPYDPAGNTFYVPVNKRGTKDNTTPGSKGMNAPPSSTYLWVDAYYLSGAQRDTIPVIYSYYLGANLMDDYNLLANKVYVDTIKITMKGDADFDYRVDDWGPVDFTKPGLERANCYILNPAPAYDRQFKIPIDRIRTFWGGEGMTETTGYEQYDPTISADSLMRKTFDAYILWTDIANTNGADGIYNTSDDLVKVDMTNTHDDYSYFTVTVKHGIEGNAIVAVTTTNASGQEEIMWSWHLWITDYRPDEIGRYVNKEKGRYIYPVTGGAVHRYAGTFWETGIYKDKFIMDRNLGALDTVYVKPEIGKGLVFYEYGRKDPLPGSGRGSVYYPKSGLPDGLQWKAISKSSGAFSDTTALRYSISHPLTFICANGHRWTRYNKYDPVPRDGSIRWLDPNVRSDEGKSIFDPCPPGYKVPRDGTWDDFRAATSTNPTTNANGDSNPPRNLPPFGSASNPIERGWKYQCGLHYYPGEGDVSNTIFYPLNGHLSNSGSFINNGTEADSWNCVQFDDFRVRVFKFQKSFVVPGYNTGYPSQGYNVRCVQE